MLNTAVRSTNFEHLLDAVLSVDSLKTFKIHSSVYQMGLDHFGVDAANTLFVSSNCWDACGASWFGLPTLWVNRANLPMERLDVSPRYVGKNLTDVLSLI